MQQHESAISVYMSPSLWPSVPLSSPSHPSRLSESTGLSSLGHAAKSHWLSILHMVVYMFPCNSPYLSHPLLPILCPHICSQYLNLHCCPANRLISTIFLDSTYICINMIFVFLFLTYFTLYNRLPTSLELTQMCYFAFNLSYSNKLIWKSNYHRINSKYVYVGGTNSLFECFPFSLLGEYYLSLAK